MNIEPVAWMLADKEKEYIRSIMAVQHDFVPQGCVEIPLYTHPVKELTEKEIVEVINEHGWRGLTGYLLTFAHAILRKASEK